MIKYKEKFIPTGNPRFDLLNNKIAEQFTRKEKGQKIKVIIITVIILIFQSGSIDVGFLLGQVNSVRRIKEFFPFGFTLFAKISPSNTSVSMALVIK